MSARQASAQFGVGISSEIRWITRAQIGEWAPRAVTRFLADLGIDRAKIVALGMGEIDQGSGSAGNPANIRVDVRLMEQ